jgi:hypothetical protein
MGYVVRTVAAIRSVVSTRRDLLLESLALRHQLGILARSNRRFRPSDRLLWLILRRVWPRWRDALVSRYLRDRLRAPSQTWRTFIANHLGQFTFISPATSPYAPSADDVVDLSGLLFRTVPFQPYGLSALSSMRARRLACIASTDIT